MGPPFADILSRKTTEAFAYEARLKRRHEPVCGGCGLAMAAHRVKPHAPLKIDKRHGCPPYRAAEGE